VSCLSKQIVRKNSFSIDVNLLFGEPVDVDVIRERAKNVFVLHGAHTESGAYDSLMSCSFLCGKAVGA
jgi:hypothetical protein